MLSHHHPTSYTVLLAVAFLAACSDPTHSMPRSMAAEQAIPLALQLPTDAAFAHGGLDTESRSAPVTSGITTASSPDTPRLEGIAALTDDERPRFLQTSTKVMLPRTAPGVALVEGFARYFGNEGEQLVTMDLKKDWVPLVYRTQRFFHADLIPGEKTMQDFVRVAINAVCGHTLMGDTGHRAWSRFPSPTGNTVETMQVADHSYSNQVSQPECPPERREETETYPAGGGGADDRHQTDEWYLCTWEVWYNSRGEEISRRLLSCTQL